MHLRTSSSKSALNSFAFRIPCLFNTFLSLHPPIRMLSSEFGNPPLDLKIDRGGHALRDFLARQSPYSNGTTLRK
nr:hypothetical protein GZ11A10_36 [uncultured archaeon GZfos11A10]